VRGYTPQPGRDYQINNKYIAYVRINANRSIPTELWLRDSSGSSSLVTTSAYVDLLNAKGEIMFDTKTRELALRNGQFLKVSSVLGRSYYRDSSWYVAIGRELFKIITIPPLPLLTGSDTGYCSNSGLQKIKIINLPDTAGGGTIDVELDGSPLSLSAADSSFSFNTTTLSAGAHSLIVGFSNFVGISADTLHFNIQAAVVPVVALSANILDVMNLIDSVKLTATDVSGGGSNPLYTFAGDGGFLNILQSQGSNNSLTIAPGKLVLGNNWIYVKMQTSASCYTVQNGLDSVNIVRDLTTGIIDVDFPGQVIGIFPNPFTDHLTINGLNPSKKYFITLFRANGQVAFSEQVGNQTTVNIPCHGEAGGIYILSIYDERRNRVLGTVKLMKTI
jgi:hypothetical protein